MAAEVLGRLAGVVGVGVGAEACRKGHPAGCAAAVEAAVRVAANWKRASGTTPWGPWKALREAAKLLMLSSSSTGPLEDAVVKGLHARERVKPSPRSARTAERNGHCLTAWTTTSSSHMAAGAAGGAGGQGSVGQRRLGENKGRLA